VSAFDICQPLLLKRKLAPCPGSQAHQSKIKYMNDKELTEVKQQVSLVQQQANSLSVNNQQEADEATVLLKQVKEAEKFMLSKKEEITRPLMASLAKVRDLFKPIEGNLADATKIIKSKILAWTIEEQDKKDKDAARVAARVEKGTMKAETAAAKIETISKDAPKSNLRIVKKIRIVDETAIPREYLVPNMTMINEAILHQGAVIPGVETYEEKSIIAR